MYFNRALASTLFLLSGSAAAFNAPWGVKKDQKPMAAVNKNVANVVAAGVISAATLVPLNNPAFAATAAPAGKAVKESLVIGTPLETKLVAFGAASYPVFNSVTDAAPLADKFLEYVEKTVKAPDAADLASNAVNGLMAIPDSAIKTYGGVLKKDVFAGVSKDSCVSLGGSGEGLKKLANSAAVKSVDSKKIAALEKKFAPANSAVPLKDGNICLPPSADASGKLWVAQAELTLSMPKDKAAPLLASIKKVGAQATRPSIAKLVPVAESTFSKSADAIKMVAAGKDVEPSVISTVNAALN